MSSSIVISNLCWSADGSTPLFDDLNLRFGAERTGLVGRNGVGKTSLLRMIAGDVRPHAGTIRFSGTVGWLRQDAATAPGETVAGLFGVAEALSRLARAEKGQDSNDDPAAIDWSLRARIETILAKYDVPAAPDAPMHRLSGGQRTRARLAALEFSSPDFLLLDEPTNDLDRAGRRAVFDLIGGWRKGALVVSHDRELLDMMDAIVELTSLGATRYGGSYSMYKEKMEEELAAARRDLAHAEKAEAEAAHRARQAIERKARTNKKGRKSRAKRDQPKVLLDKAKERSEASGGAGLRMRDARAEAARDAVAAARRRIEILQPIHMDVPSTGLPPGKQVLRLDAVSGGHDPKRPVIRTLSLSVRGPERIAVTGPNGSGKTTLLSLINGSLAPCSGTIDVHVPFALLDQHVGMLDPDLSVRENYLRMNPAASTNDCMAALARFKFRANDALQTAGTLSGGQKMRAGLACTLGRADPPPLFLLDEPTNHLDLEATEALEAALCAYDGALIVVSHDDVFLDRLKLDRRIRLGEALTG